MKPIPLLEWEATEGKATGGYAAFAPRRQCRSIIDVVKLLMRLETV
jgi:hypothetical protein